MTFELFDAIEQGDLGRVWKLVKLGQSLEDEDAESGLTPLSLAAELGHTEVVRILLESEVDPNWGGAVTPLEAGVLEGNPEIVELLIRAGAEVNRPVEEGFTPLMSAATMGNKLVVRKLLEAGARPRMKNDHGDTAIDLAEDAGFHSLAEMMRNYRPPVPAKIRSPEARPAPVNDGSRVTSSDGFLADILGTPEHRPAPAANPSGSSSNGSKRPPSHLVAPGTSPIYGPPPTRPSAAGSTASASPSPSATAVALAEEEPASGATDGAPVLDAPAVNPTDSSGLAGIEKFHAYLKVEEYEKALGMVRRREVGVDERDRAGQTALMLAATHGALELVEALLDEGADVNLAEDAEGKETALVKAIGFEGHDDIKKQLIGRLVESGADLERQHGSSGMTPLMFAAIADVYGEGGSPIDFAPTVKLLIDLGADLEACDLRGNTVWRMIKRSAMGAPTSSPYRRRLHQMLRILESAGAQTIASHEV